MIIIKVSLTNVGDKGEGVWRGQEFDPIILKKLMKLVIKNYPPTQTSGGYEKGREDPLGQQCPFNSGTVRVFWLSYRVTSSVSG